MTTLCDTLMTTARVAARSMRTRSSYRFLLLGRLSDQLGRRRIALPAIAIAAVATLAYLLALVALAMEMRLGGVPVRR